MKMLLLASIVQAQISTSDLGREQQKKVERMEVTGSHIKRIDGEGVSPLTILDRDLLAASGNTTIADMFKEQVAFEAVNEDIGYVRFHGQHAGNVLVLLNGMNLPKKDGGFYTSIRSLPSSVVERVEILKEGGSSLYGSDAMSGVINFITRSDMDGGSFTTAVTVPEEGVGVRQSHSAVWGKSFSRGNVLGMVQYAKAQAVGEYDLNSYNTDSGALSRPVSSGAFSQEDATFSVGEVCGETTCSADNLQFFQYQNATADLSVLGSARYELSSDLTLSLLGTFNRTGRTLIDAPLKIKWARHTSDGDQSLNPARLADNAPLALELRRQGMDLSSEFVELNYQLAEELGPQVRDNVERSYNVQSKLEGEIGGSWDWRWQSGFSTLAGDTHMIQGNANQSILRQMIYNGGFNPTLPSGQKSDLASAMVDPTYRTRTDLLASRVFASGEIAQLGAGPLLVSFGMDNRWESFDFKNDAMLTGKELLTTAAKNYAGDRQVHSLFAEFAATPMNSLQVGLSGRFDHYSDMGDTFNPKLALSHKPASQWLLRASVGSGFRVPGMTDVHRGDTREMHLFVDQLACDQGGGVRQACASDFYELNTFVPDTLGPETSVHYNLGAVFQPGKNLSVVIDQWNFLGKDTIARIFPNQYTELESAGRLAQLQRLGVVIERDPETGELQSLTTPYIINMGEKILRGVDVEASWKRPLGAARLGLNFSLSYIFDRRVRTFDFEPMVDEGNTWKNTAAASLQWGEHSGRLALRTVSEVAASKRKSAPTLPRTSAVDLTYAHKDFWDGKLALGVKNLFDKRPPVDETGSVISYGKLSRQMSAFSALGRRVYLSYAHTF